MIKKDLSSELWRRYQWIVPETDDERTYVIDHPLCLYYEKGSSCHIITNVDPLGQVVSHCVPSVGRYGCVLIWASKPEFNPVSFVSASKKDVK